jgi:RimJ/RimL family protein N-acetyltransferase
MQSGHCGDIAVGASPGQQKGLMMTKTPPRTVGPSVDPLPSGTKPDLRPLHGRWMWLDPVRVAQHGTALWQSFDGKDPNAEIWTWMPYGPFVDETAFFTWLEHREAARDPWFYAFINRGSGKAVGMGAFMRHDAANGVIEIGHIWMSPDLQRTREATEAIYLMMRHCFDDLGVRRLEWKCDALNLFSRSAAERFGFKFEGVFRQHLIVKGRNRDTAWYAIIDEDWPVARTGFEDWLKEDNFDPSGHQKQKLRAG